VVFLLKQTAFFTAISKRSRWFYNESMNRLKTICFIFLVISFLLSVTSFPSFAAENPLAVPNNKIGVHILFPNELPDAVKLINSNGGDWGYVTIPIQSGDRDIEKWQHFFDEA